MTPSEDIEKKNRIAITRQRNNNFSWLIADYLTQHPCLITPELMESVNPGKAMPEEVIYRALLTGFCGLDTENDEEDKYLADEYFPLSVKKLNPGVYLGNPYYRDIIIPEVTTGNWKLTHERYQPYEAFIYNDILVGPDLKEIPRVGFFSEEFLFPAVLEHDHEWMAIKPNEIETMQPVLDVIEGRVVTFGLGLGYFAYMASLREKVQHITIIEQDDQVIQLFKQHILPQFQRPDKVEIICAEAFEYAGTQMPAQSFDYAFVDLWHDVSDGLEPYLRMKKLEPVNQRTRFFYWIEKSLISGLRWQVFDWAMRKAGSGEESAFPR
ncbi:MAG TPA: hypothetical protein PKJ28_04615 [Bacteroidales bacterium]|nr:hypothetical protein [Bacteroidales bacterium]HPS73805.1 hypothetical protein [Bacteroidales bacterium]